MEINLYSRIPISFMIQFQTLIFVIFANRANVRVVRKILEIWCTCNILVKPCIILSFLTLSGHLVYLCPNTCFTYVRTFLNYLCLLYVFAFCIGSFFLLLLSRPILVLLVFCFYTCFVLLFVFVSNFTFTRQQKLFGLIKVD